MSIPGWLLPAAYHSAIQLPATIASTLRSSVMSLLVKCKNHLGQNRSVVIPDVPFWFEFLPTNTHLQCTNSFTCRNGMAHIYKWTRRYFCSVSLWESASLIIGYICEDIQVKKRLRSNLCPLNSQKSYTEPDTFQLKIKPD